MFPSVSVLSAIAIATLATLAQAADDPKPLFKCLDRIELAERFEFHYSYLYPPTEEEKDSIINGAPSSAELNKWKYYTLDARRLDSILVMGDRSSDVERQRLESPRGPLALIATRVTPNGQFAYILNSRGSNKVKLTDGPASDSDKFYFFVEKADSMQVGCVLGAEDSKMVYRLSEGFPPGPWSQNIVQEARDARKDLIDVNKTSIADDETIRALSEELVKIIEGVSVSYQRQLKAIGGFTPEQLKILKNRFGDTVDQRAFAKGLRDHYQGALIACGKAVRSSGGKSFGSLSVGVATAKSGIEIQKAFEEAYPSKP